MGNVIPTFRYEDPNAALAFLTDVFGFERHAVYEDDERVIHAELTLGSGMIMLGPTSDDAYGQMFAAPESGAAPTSSAYVIVDDPRAHAERARAGGAEIIMDPTEQDYGGVTYLARDPFGFVWSFGSYDPWRT
jgi:uncharacterized glyoxalase superfamily protein PhnB